MCVYKKKKEKNKIKGAIFMLPLVIQLGSLMLWQKKLKNCGRKISGRKIKSKVNLIKFLVKILL